MPPLDAGRVVEDLAHIGRLVVALQDFVAGAVEFAGEPQHAGHQFHRAFDFGVADFGRLEKVGIEQRPQHRADVVVVIEVGLRQDFDGLGVAGRGVGPFRHRRFVGDKEAVEVAGDEPGGGGLLADDIDDVAAVPVAGFAQESLFAVVVVLGVKLEVPRNAAIGPVGIALGTQFHIPAVGDGPAGESAGAFLDILLGVVAHAH